MKPWKIVVSDKIDPELQKKIERVLKPTRDVGRPQKCLFCGVETTWTINDRPVCPKCCVGYGFLDKGWLPGPCEVFNPFQGFGAELHSLNILFADFPFVLVYHVLLS